MHSKKDHTPTDGEMAVIKSMTNFWHRTLVLGLTISSTFAWKRLLLRLESENYCREKRETEKGRWWCSAAQLLDLKTLMQEQCHPEPQLCPTILILFGMGSFKRYIAVRCLIVRLRLIVGGGLWMLATGWFRGSCSTASSDKCRELFSDVGNSRDVQSLVG